MIEMKQKITGSGVIDKKEISKPKVKKNRLQELILNCSLYTNSERLFRTDNSGEFACLNGLRAITMIWIIAAHSFRYLGDFSYFFLMSKLKKRFFSVS